jgi:carbonic anhydrase/acetyltransferase-like protein (isoleucine patch superfamily)
MGSPARVRKELTDAECANFQAIAERYIQYQDDYRTGVNRID